MWGRTLWVFFPMNFKFKSCRLSLKHQLALRFWVCFLKRNLCLDVCVQLPVWGTPCSSCANMQSWPLTDKEEVYPFLMWRSKQKYKREQKLNYWYQKRTKKLMNILKKAKYFLKKINMIKMALNYLALQVMFLFGSSNMSLSNSLLVGGNEAKSSDSGPIIPKLCHFWDLSLLIF